MIHVHLDLETRSRVDLGTTGVARYARHPSTEVLCAAYAIDDGPVQVWRPGEPVPECFGAERTLFFAHNAAFEAQLCEHVLTARHGWPEIHLSRWRCTAAMAAFRNLPRSLDKVSELLELGDKAKSKDGRANMLKLCRPHGKGVKNIAGVYFGGKFNVDPERHEFNEAYCAQDVEAEREITRRLPPLSERMQRLWQVDRIINERGIPVDLDLCRGAVRVLDQAHERGAARLAELTEGEIETPGQTKKIVEYAERYGVRMQDCTADTVSDLLDCDALPSNVREVLTIRSDLSAASVKKFGAVLAIANEDWRCRDQFNFYSASTGRWAGRGLQPQNLKRCKPPSEELLAAITAGDYAAVSDAGGGRPVSALSSVMRSIVCAPVGNTLVHSDFSAIEARMLAWLAGDEDLLDVFREGRCVYSAMAANMYGENKEWAEWVAANKDTDPKAKNFRQTGKVAVLGLGYQCGPTQFVTMAKKMAGLTLTLDESANIVELYRSGNPKIVNLWRDLERAAVACVTKKRTIRVGRLRFKMIDDWMAIELPSGRHLFYYRPAVEEGKFGNNQVTYARHGGARGGLYGGLIAENVTQAAAADLLMDAHLRLHDEKLPVVLHVHDSVSVECRDWDTRTPKLVHEAMETLEPWAEGFPIKADTEISRRMP
jgi:DNA polymerase